MLSRTLVPEVLDGLDPNDPSARASRRDLRRINALMMNDGLLAWLAKTHARTTPRHIVDLGCGDGHGLLRSARRMARDWPAVHVTLLDARPSVQPATLDALARLGWTAEVVRADVLEWLPAAPVADITLASLFLHHFEGPMLETLLHGIAARTDLLAAAEPRRSASALIAARATWAIGANSVTRHDAPASVRAGFRAGELSSCWPGEVVCDRSRGPFTHAFAARGVLP